MARRMRRTPMAAVRMLETILGMGSSLGTAGGGSSRTTRRTFAPITLAACATLKARIAPNEAPIKSNGSPANTASSADAYSFTMSRTPASSRVKASEPLSPAWMRALWAITTEGLLPSISDFALRRRITEGWASRTEVPTDAPDQSTAANVGWSTSAPSAPHSARCSCVRSSPRVATSEEGAIGQRKLPNVPCRPEGGCAASQLATCIARAVAAAAVSARSSTRPVFCASAAQRISVRTTPNLCVRKLSAAEWPAAWKEELFGATR
eukprot:7391430-Prymnesium_polylepis.2